MQTNSGRGPVHQHRLCQGAKTRGIDKIPRHAASMRYRATSGPRAIAGTGGCVSEWIARPLASPCRRAARARQPACGAAEQHFCGPRTIRHEGRIGVGERASVHSGASKLRARMSSLFGACWGGPRNAHNRIRLFQGIVLVRPRVFTTSWGISHRRSHTHSAAF